MADAKPWPHRRPHAWWHWFLGWGTLRRHPVSLTRQRIGTTILVTLALGFAWYCFTTRDEAVRRRAIEFLGRITSGEVYVARAHFRMFGGITLYDVRVSVPYSEELDPSAEDADSREIFSAASLTLVHNTWRLLLGNLHVERIIATRPKIVLTHNIETGLRNWQLLSRLGETPRTGKPRDRVRMTIRSAIAEVVSIHADGRHEARTEELDADIRPHPQLKTAYSIEVRWSKPPDRATVIFDPGTSRVTNTPFVDARTIRLQLPKLAQDFFTRIDLRGEVKLSRLIYDAQTPETRETVIELRHVQCAVPLSMLGGDASISALETADAADSDLETVALTFTELQGQLNLQGRRLEIDVTGLIDGATCSVTGFLGNIGGAVEDIDVDLCVQGTRVPAPEGALRAQLLSDPGVPRGLQAFLRDYDPHGEFDVDFQFDRPAGSDQALRLSGMLRPRGATVQCRWFAYPVHELEGLVRFGSGLIHLEEIRGRHGPAVLTANGTIDRNTRHAAVEVDIVGDDVPLDEDLFAPLSDRYKAVWRQFAPQGSAAIRVSVRRAGAHEGSPRPPWDTRVTAELKDAAICFSAYPYPLEHVSGRLEIGGGRLAFDGLTGYRHEASVVIDGYVSLGPTQATAVDIRIEAKSMRLDDTLAAAMPPEGRAAFSQFRPQGYVDLSGRVSMADPQEGLVYDLRAKLRDATLCYEHFPYEIRGVEAEILIRPDQITVLNVSGHHGSARVSAGGTVRRLRDGYVADLTFDSRDMVLDDSLYAALPAPLREVWRLLRPGGTVHARTALHYVVENGRRQHHHRTEIEATDGNLCFRGFPLPLTSVDARVLVEDQRVDIVRLRAKACGGTIELTGQIDATPPGKRATLRIDATGMTFNEELLAAMPPPLRQWLSSVKPAGRFDLRLDPLQYEVGRGNGSADSPDVRPRWAFAGRLGLTDARGRLGLVLEHVTGQVSGTGRVGEGGVELAAHAELDRAVLAGWHLEDVSADITVNPRIQMLQVSDVAGSAYGGQVRGFAEIDLGRRDRPYQLSVTGRDIQLSRYAQMHRNGRGRGPAARSDGASVEGSVHGNLVLRGRSGRRPYREGMGEVFVRDAQIWKLPVIFALFQVLNLAPDENVFHDGWVKYSLFGDELTFRQIDLQGRAMSFAGAGRMDLRTRQLDLTLLAGSPIRFRIPFLTDILEGASRELMEVRIRGTLRHPRITPQPLKSLGKALRTLFSPPPPGLTDRDTRRRERRPQ